MEQSTARNTNAVDRLADRLHADLDADRKILDVVIVAHGTVLKTQNEELAPLASTSSHREKADPLCRKGVRPSQVRFHVLD